MQLGLFVEGGSKAEQVPHQTLVLFPGIIF